MTLRIFIPFLALCIIANGSALHAVDVDDPENGAAFDLLDSELFSPELFPDLKELSRNRLVLEGLAELYPGKVLRSLPEKTQADAK